MRKIITTAHYEAFADAHAFEVFAREERADDAFERSCTPVCDCCGKVADEGVNERDVASDICSYYYSERVYLCEVCFKRNEHEVYNAVRARNEKRETAKRAWERNIIARANEMCANRPDIDLNVIRFGLWKRGIELL